MKVLMDSKVRDKLIRRIQYITQCGLLEAKLLVDDLLRIIKDAGGKG